MKRLLPVLLLAGCACEPVARTEYQHVTVPVAVRAQPPAELTQPIAVPQELRFVPPDDAGASSALTPEGETALVQLIEDYVARIAAWHAWAVEE